MTRTLGYHIVISGYGLWLPGDNRGSWSEAWDDELGFIEPHTLQEGDPMRLRMASERMAHLPVRLDAGMSHSVAATLARCVRESDWRVVAASVESTHTHLLLTYTPRDIDTTIKWLKDRMTKDIHSDTMHQGPVWCKGAWRTFLYDMKFWDNTQRYIERHNERRGVGPRPYDFVS